MKNKQNKRRIRGNDDFEDLCEVFVYTVTIMIIMSLGLGLASISVPNFSIKSILRFEKPIDLALLLILCSLTATICYYVKRDRKFYFADLSLWYFFDRFIFISCFVAWPFFVISRVRFCHFRKRIKMSNKYKANLKDGIPLLKMKPAFDKTGFVEFCCYRWQSKNGKKCKNFIHDFNKIKALQGIRQIFIDPEGRLVIAAWIFCEIEERLYDIGDFKITIDNICLEASCDRRGDDCLLYGSPYERNNVFLSIGCFDKFYLFDKKNLVDAYIDEGNIAEAVELTLETILCINKKKLELWEEFCEEEQINSNSHAPTS